MINLFSLQTFYDQVKTYGEHTGICKTHGNIILDYYLFENDDEFINICFTVIKSQSMDNTVIEVSIKPTLPLNQRKEQKL